MARAKRVTAAQNRIAELREAAGLTRRALGARLATSPEQVERWEAGQEITLIAATCLAIELLHPIHVVFPSLASGEPANQAEWESRGFVLEAPALTWLIQIKLQGFEKWFSYLVDREAAERVAGILDNTNGYDFIAFSSNTRSIYVSTKDIQRIQIGEPRLASDVEQDFSVLEPTFSDLNLYFRGEREPMRIPSAALDLEDAALAFVGLDCSIDHADEFIPFTDEEDYLSRVRTGALLLVELPHEELVEEMQALGEGFWDD